MVGSIGIVGVLKGFAPEGAEPFVIAKKKLVDINNR